MICKFKGYHGHLACCLCSEMMSTLNAIEGGIISLKQHLKEWMALATRFAIIS